MSEDAKRKANEGIGFGVAAGAVWGFVFLTPELMPEFTPLALSAARYLLYGAVSLLFFAHAGRALAQKTRRRDWLALLALAFPGNLIYYLFVAGAVNRSGVAATSLIVGLVPVSTTLVGALEEKSLPLRRLLPPLLLSVLGVSFIYFDAPADESGRDRVGYLVGLFMAFCALASWTLFAVGNAKYLRENPRFTSHEWSTLNGVATGALTLIVLVPPAFLIPGMSTFGPPSEANWTRFWLLNVALALGPSVLGNSLWNAASRRLPLTLSGQMVVFETVFALLYGFAYEMRSPRPLEMLAALSLLGGVALSARGHR